MNLPTPKPQYDFTNEAQARAEILRADRMNLKRSEVAFQRPVAEQFSAGNFTANGSMTWTVLSGEVLTYWYAMMNSVMTISFHVAGSSVGGTPDNRLFVAIPAGKMCALRTIVPLHYLDNGGSWAVGHCLAEADGTTLQLLKANTSSWTASTNATTVYGQIAIPVT